MRFPSLCGGMINNAVGGILNHKFYKEVIDTVLFNWKMEAN